MLINTLWHSPALRAAMVYGFGGLGFTVGSLLLARAMVPTEYAWVIFCANIAQIAGGMGHLGASTLVVRHVVNADAPLLIRIAITSFITAAVLAILSVAGYGMSLGLAVILLIYCFLSSINKVSADFLRSRQKFGHALFMSQIHNGMLLVVGIIAVLSDAKSAATVCLVLALALVCTSVTGWWLAFSEEPRADAIPRASLPWREGLTFVVMDTAVLLLVGLERLAIPQLLDLHLLATFAVLAAVVGSPFKVLQMGVGFTLTPRLKAAPTRATRRILVLEEVGIVMVVLVISCLGIWILAPWVVELFLTDKYVLAPALILAGMISGFGKVFGAIGTSIITAVGDARSLKLLNLSSWVALGLGLAAAIIGARWELVGVVMGVAIGWLAYAACTLYLALPNLRELS